MNNDNKYVWKVNGEQFVGSIELLIEMIFENDGNVDIVEPSIDIVSRDISMYDKKVPLFDITSNIIYLIDKKNVHLRITNDNYRFVNDKNSLMSKNGKVMDFYDIDVLTTTMMKIFYYSFTLDTYLTSCARPSYRPGIDYKSHQPYYKTNELYYLALDWDLLGDDLELEPKDIDSLCEKISKYDLDYGTLQQHQKYIHENNVIGLVKYYTFFGSYYINNYLRNKERIENMKKSKTSKKDNDVDDSIENIVLNRQIEILTNVISNSPFYNKSFYVYRFISNDTFMNSLKVGDIWKENSFLSTTRNPFYATAFESNVQTSTDNRYDRSYSFGSILLKIKIPSNIPGIGLAVESYSNFPHEEEIVLSPLLVFRITSITNVNSSSYSNYLRLTKKYEMEIIGGYQNGIGSSESDINYDSIESNTIPVLDLDITDDVNIIPINKRLDYFLRNTITSTTSQFRYKINNKYIIFNIYSFDSTSIYGKFFKTKTPNGIMIIVSNLSTGNISLLIEVGYDLHINYYFKYSVSDSMYIESKEWMLFFSKLSFHTGSRNVFFYSNWSLCSNNVNTICTDIVDYITKGDDGKRFVGTIVEPQFKYSHIEMLNYFVLSDLATRNDKDPLWSVMNKVNYGNKSVRDIFLYIINNRCELIPLLIKKIKRMFIENEEDINNPFMDMNYKLDGWAFLMNENLVEVIPIDKKFSMTRTKFSSSRKKNNVVKFENRLRNFVDEIVQSKSSK